ncbi:excinuclease ABC subunit C [Campylobacter ureolyticus]|nr:excinuclease ABC subunit C [Campylobacter ureolyticus]
MLINDIKSLPNLPGVYEYFDENGKLLYVGKAKNLKKRVRSYFSFTPKLAPNPRVSLRIQKMINESIHLKYIVTKSEADALILENSFIKQLNPKYNILLRDDKTYPYIYIDLNENFPRFNITRKVIKGSNIKYFGPYFKGSREILETLYMKFKLIQKKGCLKNKKACLFYQINRCLAPCEEK